MAKFNIKQNNSEEQILSLWLGYCFGQFLSPGFYISAEERIEKMFKYTIAVGENYGWPFVARLAIYTRNVGGMRSVSHIIACVLNNQQFEGKRAFFRNIPNRIDDMGEILSLLDITKQKRSHALVAGFKDYISGCSEYQLAKYKMLNKQYNLYDIVNITHAHSEGIDKLKKDILPIADTWETAISKAENDTQKKQEWIRLVNEDKLGYLASLRNINNIIDVLNPDSIEDSATCLKLCSHLRDKDRIRNSKVFPMQLYTAMKNIKGNKLLVNAVRRNLDRAFKYSIENLPAFNGSTLFILDVSGSMAYQQLTEKSCISVLEACAVYLTALLEKQADSDIYKFGSRAVKFKYSNTDLTYEEKIKELTMNQTCGHGTEINSVFNLIGNDKLKLYDNIVIFSDFQTADFIRPVTQKILNKKKVYSFDLGGCGESLFTPRRKDITGLNPDIIKLLVDCEDLEYFTNYINKNFTYL